MEGTDMTEINAWYGPAKLKAHFIIEVAPTGNGKARCGKRQAPSSLVPNDDADQRCANCVKLMAQESVEAPQTDVQPVAEVPLPNPADKATKQHQDAVEAAKQNAATRKEKYGSALSERTARPTKIGASDDNGQRCGGLAASSPDPVVPRMDGAAWLPIGSTGMAGVRPDPEIVNVHVGGTHGYLTQAEYEALTRSAKRRYWRKLAEIKEKARKAEKAAKQRAAAAERMRAMAKVK